MKERMIHRRGLSAAALAVAALLAACAPSNDGLVKGPGGRPLEGDYIGQAPAGDEAEVFAPGIVNTGMYTRDLTMTPDGSEIYFCVNVGRFDYTAVLVTRRVEGGWTVPEVAPFSADLSMRVAEPFISPDGSRMYFASNSAPASSGEEETAGDNDYDIWVMDRAGDGWGEPRLLEGPVNTPDSEFFPTVTRDGTVYFCRAEPETGIHYIYRSRMAGGQYQPVEKLPEQVNCGRSMFNATISPDEDFIIVPVFGREGGVGGVDYYISFRDPGDEWSEPVNMGPGINTPGSQEYSASISPDGRFLFFMSARREDAGAPVTYRSILEGMDRPGNGNPCIYWMSAAVIDRLREEASGADAEKGEDAETAGGADEGKAANTASAGSSEVPVSGGEAPAAGGDAALEDALLDVPAEPYLGQEPPGTTPELFAPGIVSNGLFNRDCIASADGREMFIGLIHGNMATVLWTRLTQGGWTRPEIVPFALGADFNVFEPALSPAEDALYFLTNKAAPGQTPRPGWGNQNIFFSSRAQGEWSEPAPSPVVSEKFEYYPSFTSDGTIYFTHHERGTDGAIYRARPEGEGYGEPERLGPEVNCGKNTYNAFVALDESYIIVCADGRDDLVGKADYYIAFRNGDDEWTGPINMGEPINLPGASASSSFVTRDGKYFFFASDRKDDGANVPGGKLTVEVLKRLYHGPQNGLPDIYWVSAEVIERLRP